MDDIDRLLADMSGQRDPPKPSTSSLDKLLHELKEDVKQSVRSNLLKRPQPPSPPIPDLAKLKSDLDKQQQAQQQAAEQQERERQQRLKELETQRRAELTEYASQWLRQLDPRSNEGLWFDEFACNYDSRLEAAVEYLEALQKVERGTI